MIRTKEEIKEIIRKIIEGGRLKNKPLNELLFENKDELDNEITKYRIMFGNSESREEIISKLYLIKQIQSTKTKSGEGIYEKIIEEITSWKKIKVDKKVDNIYPRCDFVFEADQDNGRPKLMQGKSSYNWGNRNSWETLARDFKFIHETQKIEPFIFVYR